MIIIPSMRTPNNIINLANDYFGKEHLVIKNVDKKAYLSGLSLAKYIIVTCDSSSMISEAALTGKPVYVAMFPATKSDKRFQKFRNLLENIRKQLILWWARQDLNLRPDDYESKESRRKLKSAQCQR